jgi:hypothetical protein
VTSSEAGSLTVVQEGIPVKHTLDAGEIMYYQYYNWYSKDIEISISVPSGEVDLYVNTFKDDPT